MKTKIFFFILGFVSGGVGLFFFQSGKATHVRSAALSKGEAIVTEDTREAPSLRKELSTAKARVVRLEAENAKLNRELKASPSTTAPAQMAEAHPFRDKGSNFSETMQKFREASAKQQIEAQIAGMKLRLKLTPEQEEAVRKLLYDQHNLEESVVAKQLQGAATKEELDQWTKSSTDVEAQLKQVLTPEQSTEYDKHKVEKQQLQSEMVANVQLGQLQQMLDLDASQQDQVFNLLYQLNENPPKTEGGVPMSWEQRLQAQKEALRAILSPAQFQSYERQQQLQQEMVEALKHSMEDPGGGDVQP